MKVSRIGSALRIVAVATLVFSAFSGLGAQPTSTGPALPEAVDHDSASNAILTAWGDYQIPVDAENNTPYGPFDLRRALKRATPEQLLDARNAKTFDDVVAALPRTTASGVVPRALASGERIPLVLGDLVDDLVYTPLTPCRIMDTRFQTVPARIGPDGTGVQRFVVGTNYASQGGFAGSCGIPATGPAAYAMNIATTNQSGTGSLRIIPTGAGNPNVAIMNYSPIQNISNAAVVAAATGAGPNIFIFSASAATDVIIDVMGYFTSPAATPLDRTTVEGVATACLTATTCSAIATCPAGYVATGGGYRWDNFAPLSAGREVASTEASGLTSWFIQAQNNTGGTQGLHSFVSCARVPGH
jgi:hypothetical protein